MQSYIAAKPARVLRSRKGATWPGVRTGSSEGFCATSLLCVHAYVSSREPLLGGRSYILSARSPSREGGSLRSPNPLEAGNRYFLPRLGFLRAGFWSSRKKSEALVLACPVFPPDHLPYQRLSLVLRARTSVRPSKAQRPEARRLIVH